LIANARMYSVSAQVANLWRRLLLELGRVSGTDLEVVEHPAPAPLEQLWQREDKAAVFMCGLPYARGVAAGRIMAGHISVPRIIAAPVPSPPDFQGMPRYWSELVVRSDSHFATLADTFGRRIAFTVAQSQSGYAAPLNLLRTQPGAHPRYAEVVAPCVTPLGALEAVIDGAAEVAPIDSYAFALLARYCPGLSAQVRSVARTAPTPIPPLVASAGAFTDSAAQFSALQTAFLQAHLEPGLRALMQALLLERFELPDPATYEQLNVDYEKSLAFWRQHAIASIVHPAFL
jgi:ABC-type phosphate/phosphonate transport system substrate-binding protein